MIKKIFVFGNALVEKDSLALKVAEKLKEKVKKGANKEGRSFSDYACRVLDKHA